MRQQIFIVVVFASWLAGCGTLVPREQQRSESIKATEAIATHHDTTIRRVTEVVPQMFSNIVATRTNQPTLMATAPPVHTGSPISTSLVVPEAATPSQAALSTASLPAMRETLDIRDTTGAQAGSTDDNKGATSSSIPLGVKIGLLGGGLAILGVVLAVGWNYVKSTGVGAALAVADSHIAAFIRTKNAVTKTTTDPVVMNAQNADVAELEAIRGRIQGALK